MMRFIRRLTVLLVLAPAIGFATPLNSLPEDLTSLSLEELMQVKVTTASRKPELLMESPSATYVLSQADIRRSGATNIPDALRLVPGLHVARLDASKWAVTARGFNGRFANKLLVLIDGRSVYTPLFSGVYWDFQDTLLEDIDRIEIVRGPGGSLWGANAVNGVINIITRRAKESQGTLVTAGVGNEERRFLTLRHGGQSGDDAYFRVWAKGYDRDDGLAAGGIPGADGWSLSQAGFRLDNEAGTRDRVTVQADVFDGRAQERIALPTLTAPFTRTTEDHTSFRRESASFRLERRFSEASDFALQLYYDQVHRTDLVLGQAQQTFDLDFQRRVRPWERHELIWGMEYRHIDDSNSVTSGQVTLQPPSRVFDIASAFVQDEYRFDGDEWRLTFGTKLERNDFTGFVLQPNARILWTPDGRRAAWAAVSRAARTPSRIESDGRVDTRVVPGPGGVPLRVSLFGSPDFDSEELLATEIGYRVEPKANLGFDATAFHNRYECLRTLEGPVLSAARPGVLAFTASNLLDGEANGFELAADWRPNPDVRLRSGYTFLTLSLEPRAGSRDPTARAAERESPRHQLFTTTALELTDTVELDCTLRYVDSLPALAVPSYVTADVRIGWKPRTDLELALVGRNLLDDRQIEFKPSFIDTQATEVERSVYGKVTWRF